MSIMKYMILLVMLVSSQANAVSLKATGLSSEQIAKLELQAATMVVEANEAKLAIDNAPILNTVVDKIGDFNITEESLNRYSGMGQKVGKILTGFWVEIGITAQSFLSTNWGFLAMLLVGWHYFASDIANLALANVIMLFFIPLWLRFAYNLWFPFKTYTLRNGEVETQIVKRKYNSEDVSSWFEFNTLLVLIMLIVMFFIAVRSIG